MSAVPVASGQKPCPTQKARGLQRRRASLFLLWRERLPSPWAPHVLEINAYLLIWRDSGIALRARYVEWGVGGLHFRARLWLFESLQHHAVIQAILCGS